MRLTRLKMVVFPAPFGPIDGEHLTGVHLEAHAVEGPDAAELIARPSA